jgi:hypothetical protein
MDRTPILFQDKSLQENSVLESQICHGNFSRHLRISRNCNDAKVYIRCQNLPAFLVLRLPFKVSSFLQNPLQSLINPAEPLTKYY